jgi:PPOX class probable F420-dependent enzyme
MPVPIPDTHRDLLEGPHHTALSTIMPNGQPQTTVIWCSYDGTYVWTTTTSHFQKVKNMRANPKVTLLAYDPENPLRSIEVRGEVVELTEQDALAHLDRICELYTGLTPYYGACVPAELQETEIPLLVRIAPTRVRVEGS